MTPHQNERENITEQYQKKCALLHSEKCFVESTKIWLAQHNFSFEYGSVEILFKLTKNIVFIYITPTKKFSIVRKKRSCKLKLQKYFRFE